MSDLLSAFDQLGSIWWLRSLSINKDRSAFIHVPPLGKPWSAEEMAAAISLCISEFLRQLQDKQMLL